MSLVKIIHYCCVIVDTLYPMLIMINTHLLVLAQGWALILFAYYSFVEVSERFLDEVKCIPLDV